MKKLDWKGVGQFVALLVSLFSLVRDTLTKVGVGIEIVEWIVGEGKAVFVEEFLKPLATKFLVTQRWKTVNATTIMVNLGLSPRLPFDSAIVKWHRGEGWVRVQKRKDGLYVGGRKVILYLSERQKNGGLLKGHELREELTGKPVLNANLLDMLFDNQHLIPEDFKKDADGNTIYIYFWDSGFRSPDTDRLCVRCLYFYAGVWYRSYGWLGLDWFSSFPAALLATLFISPPIYRRSFVL